MTAARLCLWLVSPLTERAHGAIAPAAAVGGAGAGAAAAAAAVPLGRTLKLFYRRLGAAEPTPAGWAGEEAAETVRMVMWSEGLLLVVSAALQASTVQQCAPGCRAGPNGFAVGFLPLG